MKSAFPENFSDYQSKEFRNKLPQSGSWNMAMKVWIKKYPRRVHQDKGSHPQIVLNKGYI